MQSDNIDKARDHLKTLWKMWWEDYFYNTRVVSAAAGGVKIYRKNYIPGLFYGIIELGVIIKVCLLLGEILIKGKPGPVLSQTERVVAFLQGFNGL